MVSPSGFKWWLGATDVGLLMVFRTNFCLINYTIFQTVLIHGAGIFSTVASTIINRARNVSAKDFLVVARYNGCHVTGTTITYFNIVLVEQFPKFMMGWEMFCQKGNEFLTHISASLGVIWWIKPYNVFRTVPSFWCRLDII